MIRAQQCAAVRHFVSLAVAEQDAALRFQLSSPLKTGSHGGKLLVLWGGQSCPQPAFKPALSTSIGGALDGEDDVPAIADQLLVRMLTHGGSESNRRRPLVVPLNRHA